MPQADLGNPFHAGDPPVASARSNPGSAPAPYPPSDRAQAVVTLAAHGPDAVDKSFNPTPGVPCRSIAATPFRCVAAFAARLPVPRGNVMTNAIKASAQRPSAASPARTPLMAHDWVDLFDSRQNRIPLQCEDARFDQPVPELMGLTQRT